MPQSAQEIPVNLSHAARWVIEAGRIALDRQRSLSWRRDVALKGDGSPVTAIDHEVEAYLVERIRRYHPTHRVLAEESGQQPGTNELIWVIDPIDGTRAYASGLPVWGVSVGVFVGAAPHAGVVHLPVPDETYAIGPGVATLNGKPLTPSHPVEWDHPLAFVAISSDAHRHFDIDYPRIRTMGSTVAHLIYVARSTAVGALIRRAGLWDLAGALPLLAHCGVEIEYLGGGPFQVSPLLTGEPIREPLIVARPENMDRLRVCLRDRRDVS